jgi:hypothetical protein
MEQISDYEWLEANLDPAAYRTRLGIQIPDLPPDEVQLRFAGRLGRANLQHAFDFYKFVLAHLPKLRRDRYNILDFGGGWGRVLRFFLREFPAERLILADCLTDAVEYARSLNSSFNIIHSDVNPPLSLAGGSIGLCYSFSVFSHLAERSCADWLCHFAQLLVPGGNLIITTRGKAQIEYLETLAQADSPNPLLALLPSPEIIRKRYEQGFFQFYPAGGGGELTPDFYGETWIPRKWLEDRYASLGYSACQYYPEFETVDQCVFVLTK